MTKTPRVYTADYYRKRRHIPEHNLIHINIDPAAKSLSRETFDILKKKIDEQMPAGIQAIALTWAQPYRVDCMSITTAMAIGFDPAFCSSECGVTRISPYAGNVSQRPYTEVGIRPTMMLAARTQAQARNLIDRGVAADGSKPFGYVYLMDSPDKARNVRALQYADFQQRFGQTFPVHIEKGAELQDKTRVLMAVTGAATLKKMASNQFVPGAVADHLTSFGGRLTDSTQTSALEWLEAGATGSYGTVMEPCNLPSKFPNPGALLHFYLQGETLVEAYWKSVQMPGQGVFVGDPLAAPFRR